MTRSELTAALRAAFLTGVDHEGGWDAVAAKAEELLGVGSYEGIESIIGELPQTWIPALTRKIVETGYAKKVWMPGRCSAFVAGVERRKDQP